MSRATQVPTNLILLISSTRLSLSLVQISICFDYQSNPVRRRPYYTAIAETITVWAAPRSLATTYGITFVFFSYGYLDVSVPRVRFMLSMMSQSLATGFPIRTSAGRFVFADNRSFSQLITSFFASESHRHPPCALVCFSFSLLVLLLFKAFERFSCFCSSFFSFYSFRY